jgi:hypothetical protein
MGALRAPIRVLARCPDVRSICERCLIHDVCWSRGLRRDHKGSPRTMAMDSRLYGVGTVMRLIYLSDAGRVASRYISFNGTSARKIDRRSLSVLHKGPHTRRARRQIPDPDDRLRPTCLCARWSFQDRWQNSNAGTAAITVEAGGLVFGTILGSSREVLPRSQTAGLRTLKSSTFPLLRPESACVW